MKNRISTIMVVVLISTLGLFTLVLNKRCYERIDAKALKTLTINDSLDIANYMVNNYVMLSAEKGGKEYYFVIKQKL